MVIAIVAIVIILGLAGTYSYLLKTTGDANPFSAIKKATTGLTLNPNCDYHDDNLCKFINSYHALDQATITMTGNDPENGPSTTVVQFNGQHQQVTYTVNGRPMYDIITIDQTTYTKDFSDNKWWKQLQDSDSQTSQADIKFDIPSATASSSPDARVTFQSLGKEGCGQLTCFKYQSITGTDPDSAETFWFDDVQYRLRQTQTNNPDGTKSTAIYTYNPVTIQIPADTKEPADGQTILPNGQNIASPNLDLLQPPGT